MDYKLFKIINDLAGHWDILDYIMIFSAQALILFLGFGVAALSITRMKEWGKELFFDAAIGVCTALFINWLVPLFYLRPRPFLDHAVAQLLPIDPASKSFPSDHSAISFAIAMAVFQYNKFWGIIFFILASFVSVGRIYGGIHYPADILAGAAIGAIASVAVKKFLDYLLKRSKSVL
ncbi:MAG: phosphatase PAP2 family protein [Patescibacteria group bacterium]